MITRFSDQMPPVDTGLSKLLVQIAGDQKITKTMSDATLHTLQAHLKGRQQDHVMDTRQTGPTYECRQQPWPENSVIDHEADVSQSASCSCSCLDDDSVLTARLRQPRQDVSLFDHGEEAVAGDERAGLEPIGQVLRH